LFGHADPASQIVSVDETAGVSGLTEVRACDLVEARGSIDLRKIVATVAVARGECRASRHGFSSPTGSLRSPCTAT
jgi:hypothetical protein